MQDLSRLQVNLQYKFSSPDLLYSALTHRSKSAKNNERLEFLGDSILSFVISSILYKLYPSSNEGSLTRLRAYLVKGETLAEIARKLEISEFLILGPGENKSGGHNRKSILADSLEAIIGAIYLDSSIKDVSECIQLWFSDKLENLAREINKTKDSKTTLQELLQAKQLPLPEYILRKIVGEQHQQTFYVECRIQLLDQPVGGEGTSLKNAEQLAAENALKLLS